MLWQFTNIKEKEAVESHDHTRPSKKINTVLSQSHQLRKSAQNLLTVWQLNHVTRSIFAQSSNSSSLRLPFCFIILFYNHFSFDPHLASLQTRGTVISTHLATILANESPTLNPKVPATHIQTHIHSVRTFIFTNKLREHVYPCIYIHLIIEQYLEDIYYSEFDLYSVLHISDLVPDLAKMKQFSWWLVN